MWLELIEKLFSETKLIYINADLPLAVFMIKLLKPHIKFDNFVHFQTFIDYSTKHQSMDIHNFQTFIGYCTKHQSIDINDF